MAEHRKLGEEEGSSPLASRWVRVGLMHKRGVLARICVRS